MLRLAPLLVLLVAGCLGAPALSPPGPLAPQGPADDGVRVVAIRVEPLVHAIDLQDDLSWRACTRGVGEACHGPASLLGGTTGVEWDIDVHDFADAQALFWRVALDLRWDGGPGQSPPALRLEVAVTRPCGAFCVQDRVIEALEGDGALRLAPHDIFLVPGETGIRLRIQPVDSSTPAADDIAYDLRGYAAGFRAVAPPVDLA